MHRAAASALLTLIGSALSGFTGTAATPLTGRIVESSFASAAGPLSYDVYLPPGYDTTRTRYPTLYYLHGLPAGPGAYRTFSYVPAALEAAGLQAIVVAPEAATASDPDPEFVDWGPGRDWDTAISVQLPRVVDSLYRTIPDRSGRGILGVSAGGYGAMLLGLHHLHLYSAIESWSGYFHPTDPTGTRTISSRSWLSAHAFVKSLPRALVANPMFLGFYVGDGDRLFRQENVGLARELSRANVPFNFRIYAGGHTQALWTANAPAWLTLLLQHRAPAN